MFYEVYNVVKFCLFFVIALCLALVFILSFMHSVENGREPKDRICDLVTGVLVFYIFTIILNMWRY